ncbi:MAG: exodeoxyribonuclease VII large subunit [Pseudomonadota bacterium]
MSTGEIWTVSNLNTAARKLLERGLGTVWIEAEVSNLARPGSGHLYFSLKDASAQLRAAFFRQRQRGSVRDLREGDQVLVRGKLSLYEPRGDYQLIVEHLEPAGEGLLRRAFEALRKQLDTEGLFDSTNKRPLPEFPKQIGVITSTSTAALQDVLNVLRRRMPSVPVLVYPSPVQGAQAPAALTQAVQLASARAEVDVLLIVRGGGSLEDLAAFNDEALARAVAECRIPVISGVGHETDVTIVDFVADERAPTPSIAAELSVPDANVLIDSLRGVAARLVNAQTRRLQRDTQRLDQASRRLLAHSPAQRLTRQTTQLSSLQLRLQRALQQQLQQRLLWHTGLQRRLWRQHPDKSIQALTARVARLSQRSARAIRLVANTRQKALSATARHLHAVSPLAVLARGFAIVTHSEHGEAITSGKVLQAGDQVNVRFQDGSVSATIDAEQSSQRADDPDADSVER